jgi:ribosomal protein L37AE/L43A
LKNEGENMKKLKICNNCGKVYNPKITFIKINKNLYFCEDCFRKNFGPVYEHDEEIDKIWKEVNKRGKWKK